jgi:prophage maintenance system killer protein
VFHRPGVAERRSRRTNGRCATGTRDAGALEAAVARLYARYDETELFLLPLSTSDSPHGISNTTPPFVDGNKRAGLLVEAALLYLAGYGFSA